MSGKLGWLIAFLGAGATLCFVAAILMTAVILTSETGVRALNMDFRVFWAAARLALSGDALAVFDQARLSAEHGVGTETRMPWLYPPGALTLVLPFGALSFSAAFVLWTVLSLTLLALALLPFIGGSRPLWIAAALAPAYLPALVIGQTSLLWMAGLVAALAALNARRWVLAGVLIGCLTLKPQLGMMIPIALFAAGAWRTMFAATATAIILAGLPTLLYGIEYWLLLSAVIAEQGQIMIAQIGKLDLMVGPLALLASLGVPPDLAIKLQWLISAGSGLAVFLLWRSSRIGPDVKAAGLLSAILLSAPYLWYHEVALMAGIGLFLLRAGILTANPAQFLLLVLFWLGAGLQAINVFLDFTSQGLIGAVLITPVLVAGLVLCLLHLAAANRAAPHPA